MRLRSCAKQCIVQISARAFQRIFSCKILLRYRRERALSSLPDRAVQQSQAAASSSGGRRRRAARGGRGSRGSGPRRRRGCAPRLPATGPGVWIEANESIQQSNEKRIRFRKLKEISAKIGNHFCKCQCFFHSETLKIFTRFEQNSIKIEHKIANQILKKTC